VGTGDWSALKTRFSHLEGVVFFGEVDDLLAQYAQARAAIAPIFFGGGSQIKVIEACANGRPVITTPFCRGGYEGPIRDMLDATDDPTEFAELCVRYLSDPAAARDKGRQLQAQQDADYSWHGVVERIRQDVLSLPARRVVSTHVV
jgi:glycosyltransferase involved in cell wall biosynthesis